MQTFATQDSVIHNMENLHLRTCKVGSSIHLLMHDPSVSQCKMSKCWACVCTHL